MRRHRPYVSGDCGTLLAVCTSWAKNCWQLKLLPKTPRIMEVWFIFISISFYLVSTLSLLEMTYWAISGEIILRRSLTGLGIMGLVIKDRVMLMGSHLPYLPNEVCCILKFNRWKVFMSIQKPGSRLEPYSCLESSSQEGS